MGNTICVRGKIYPVIHKKIEKDHDFSKSYYDYRENNNTYIVYSVEFTRNQAVYDAMGYPDFDFDWYDIIQYDNIDDAIKIFATIHKYTFFPQYVGKTTCEKEIERLEKCLFKGGYIMKYSDVAKAGLCGILPKKKRYGSHKDITIIDQATRNNTAFCQKAMAECNADYINDIIGKMTAFVLKCNEIYNEEAEI